MITVAIIPKTVRVKVSKKESPNDTPATGPKINLSMLPEKTDKYLIKRLHISPWIVCFEKNLTFNQVFQQIIITKISVLTLYDISTKLIAKRKGKAIVGKIC